MAIVTRKHKELPAILAALPATVAQYFVLHPANPQPRLIRQAAEILRRYPADRVTIVPLGIDPRRFAGVERRGAAGGPASWLRLA